MTQPSDVTTLLHQWRDGKAEALEELIPLVYTRLRQIARSQLSRERGAVTLQPTALVHEAYLHLVGKDHPQWRDRVHFYAVASLVMRRLVIDHARKMKRKKRGGGERIVLSADDAIVMAPDRAEELLDLNEALEALQGRDERRARVVEMRFFGGMTVNETAEVLGVAPTTVNRDWRLAKAWLYEKISAGRGGWFDAGE